MRNRWDKFTTSVGIFWEDVAPGFAWAAMLFIFFGGIAGGSVAAFASENHGRAPNPTPSVTATATTPSYDLAAINTALQAGGYVAGPTDTFIGNGRFTGVLWTSQTGAPNIVQNAGSQKGPIAQVRAVDGSFWCAAPEQYRDNPSAAVTVFNEMVARYKKHFAVGETLRLDIVVEQKPVKVVCGRVL